MTITAKYPSTCAVCGRRIQVGEQIEWKKGSPARHTGCKASASKSAAPRKSSFPSSAPAAGAELIRMRRRGRSDGRYDKGDVFHGPNVHVVGGGEDGHWYYVYAARMASPNEDNGDYDWMEELWVRPATMEEATAPAAKRAAAELRSKLKDDLPAAIRAGHDGADPRMPSDKKVPAGATRIQLDGNVAGSTRVYVTDERAWYVDSMGDDYACWTAPMTDAIRSMVAALVPDAAIAGKTTPVGVA